MYIIVTVFNSVYTSFCFVGKKFALFEYIVNLDLVCGFGNSQIVAAYRQKLIISSTNIYFSTSDNNNTRIQTSNTK